jgi:hypothetical protein
VLPVRFTSVCKRKYVTRFNGLHKAHAFRCGTGSGPLCPAQMTTAMYIFDKGSSRLLDWYYWAWCGVCSKSLFGFCFAREGSPDSIYLDCMVVGIYSKSIGFKLFGDKLTNKRLLGLTTHGVIPIIAPQFCRGLTKIKGQL